MNPLFSLIFLLHTPADEVGFFIKKRNYGFCAVGRRITSKEEVLLGIDLRFFTFKLGKASYSYSVIPYKDGCLAGVVFEEGRKHKIALVYYTRKEEKVLKVISKSGNLMLWQVYKTEDGLSLVGGIKGKHWKPFILELSEDLKEKSLKVLNLNGYFYSVVEWKGITFAVGRVKRKTWDALIYKKTGTKEELHILDSGGKDYLRFVNVVHGKPIAVGRTEIKGESDFLIVDLENLKYYLYDVAEYDYARAIGEYGNGFIVAGETRFNGNNDGVFFILTRSFKPLKAYRLGWEHTDAIRFMDFPFFIGYSYSFSFGADLLLGIFSEKLPQVPIIQKGHILKTYGSQGEEIRRD
ncbi:hypothetical protein [Aquifex sp.]